MKHEKRWLDDFIAIAVIGTGGFDYSIGYFIKK